MASGEDWLLRPAVAGLCRYTDLRDGSVDLEDVARMNDALDVVAENERRAIDRARRS